MGAEEGEDPVGLVCDPGLVGTISTSYSVDSVFESFGAYPQQWIRGKDGEIVYGSLTEETKTALAYLRELYKKGILDPDTLSKEERAALIKENPAYGNIICRCEMITEGEILDAIHRPLGATTLDGIKRRTRAGMGRCQAGFCSPRQIEILARELGVDQSEIRKSGRDSKFIVGTPKDRL